MCFWCKNRIVFYIIRFYSLSTLDEGALLPALAMPTPDEYSTTECLIQEERPPHADQSPT